MEQPPFAMLDDTRRCEAIIIAVFSAFVVVGACVEIYGQLQGDSYAGAGLPDCHRRA